jgi:hypothetical protein
MKSNRSIARSLTMVALCMGVGCQSTQRHTDSGGFACDHSRRCHCDADVERLQLYVFGAIVLVGGILYLINGEEEEEQVADVVPPGPLSPGLDDTRSTDSKELSDATKRRILGQE